jgi:hypothetical protein
VAVKKMIDQTHPVRGGVKKLKASLPDGNGAERDVSTDGDIGNGSNRNIVQEKFITGGK